MRLLSATGIVAVALVAAGCASRTVRSPNNDEHIVAQLQNLGVEGRTYTNDLGAVRSVYLKDVHTVGSDFLLEDIHGHLTYVSGATMNPVWDYYGMPQAFDRRPDSTDTAIMGISDGHLYVITRNNGTTTMAPRRLGVVPSAAPVATESTLYVPTYSSPSSAKSFSTVSLGSGYVGWGARTTAEITSNLAKGGPGGGDTVYAAATDGALYAFPTDPASASRPEPSWTAHARGSVFFELVVDGDDLGVVTSDGRLICYDRITGEVRWEASPNSSTERPEGPAQFSENLAFVRVNGQLRAFDRKSGMAAWTLDGGRAFLRERDDFMLVSGDGGNLMRVETKTGEVVATEHMPNVRIPASTDRNTTIHAITNDGLIVGVEYGF